MTSTDKIYFPHHHPNKKDSCKKLEEVLDEFCGPSSTYKFNQDEVRHTNLNI